MNISRKIQFIFIILMTHPVAANACNMCFSAGSNKGDIRAVQLSVFTLLAFVLFVLAFVLKFIINFNQRLKLQSQQG